MTIEFQDEASYIRRLEDGTAFVEGVLAFLLSLGFQLKPQATGRVGGCLTRPSHDVRVRPGGVTIWRMPGRRGKTVFTVLLHVSVRDCQMRPGVACNALLATHGGLS